MENSVNYLKKISKTLKSKYAVVCNNGTSALLMAILALELDKLNVIIPNINFIASANIVSLLKGKLFCDVNKNWNGDLNSFKEILNKCKLKRSNLTYLYLCIMLEI